ncbi:MAG: M14 family zinc carboxypeptidase [Actinomycetota bacterium]
MKRPLSRPAKAWLSIATTAALALPALAIAVPAGAQLAPPFDGNPISHGLGPTYGEAWCADAAPGSSIANQQGAPLALIPQEAIGCTLDQFLAEAEAAGIPERMSYSAIGQSEAGRDQYGVVVNARETWQQRRDAARWALVRATMLDRPAFAQSRLAAWGEDVKIPIFIEANIHGGEEEGTDAIMQVIRDLVTTPYGVNASVDALLDHAILVVIPSQNPDGRFLGTRANGNGLDMNRDLLVQSQAEIRANVAFQQRWLAPVGLAMHGYVSPTLIDGLTKPHNPGIDYDLFVKWNQPRLDANEAALAAVGMGITRPVNQWNGDAEDTPPPVGPAYAEGWDDWGPFYTQTYMAFYGVDGSTLEMCSSGPGCDGRFGSWRAQYVGFYSSADFWIANRDAMLHDQVEIFRRGVTGASRPNCCDAPDIANRGFTEDQHNWMVPYPTAFVIPFDGAGQRSDVEANRLVRWLLDNGIEVRRTFSPYRWGATTFPARSYVVWMTQAMRGLALTTLDEGQDISDRITQLYAPPGAWSHGSLWGADVVEIPTGDTAFRPRTFPIRSPNLLSGGVRAGKSDWYSLTLRGVGEVRAVLDLVRAGIDGEIAEEAFTSTSGGPSPAGTVIFPDDHATVAALRTAGRAAGVYFERNRGVKPPTTQFDESPRIAILVNSANPTRSDTSQSLRSIFGAAQADFVSTIQGPGSLQNAASDPLAGFDVIYNAGQNFPGTATIAAAPLGATQTGTTVTIQTTGTHNVGVGSTVTIAGVGEAAYDGTYEVTSVTTSNTFTYESAVSGLAASGGGTVAFTTARDRLGAFFAAGGGYLGTSQSANNFAFLTGAGLVTSPLTQGSDQAGGGIARWTNDGVAGPVTGGYPAEDFLYLPSNITYFSAVPADAVVDGRYLADTTSLFVAGLWLDRDPLVAGAPMVVHGTTTVGSRYLGLATNPLSRMDAEREWLLIGQAALWANLTDEA